MRDCWQPFFMLNLLKIVDLDGWRQYSEQTSEPFKKLTRGGEVIYAGRLRGAPVPIKGEGIDASDYNTMLLVKYPSTKGFLDFIDSPEYQAAYTHRFHALEEGKSHLVATFPVAGSATEGLAVKVPGADD